MAAEAPECPNKGEKWKRHSTESFSIKAETSRVCVELRRTLATSRQPKGTMVSPHPAAPQASSPASSPERTGRRFGAVASLLLRCLRRRVPSCPPARAVLSLPNAAYSLGWAAIIAARLAVCLSMSYGGFSNRVAYGASKWSVARDALCAAAENSLVLMSWEWAYVRFPSVAGMHIYQWVEGVWTPGPPSLVAPKESCSHGGVGAKFPPGIRPLLRRFRQLIGTCLRRFLFYLLALVWLFGSWGDYAFQTESSGQLPTMWVVAPGLKDPALHAKTQMQAKGEVFWGGLRKVSVGLLVGIVGWTTISWVHWKLRKKAEEGSLKKKDCELDCAVCAQSRRMTNDNKSRCCTCQEHHNARPMARNPPVLMVTLVLVLFLTGSWSPMTNLIYCALGSMILPPPGGRRMDPKILVKKRAKIIAERGIPAYATNTIVEDREPTNEQPSRRPPNVIVVVHESLGGAALESKRGQDAAPFWHKTLKSDPDFYSFQNGRAVAGTTPVATPAILTGLLSYEDECMLELRAASLGHEFGSAGYDTGSFVSYGHDWAGGAWDVIDDMVKPGYDFLAGPKQTGEPVVNEYGMDDRVLVQYLIRWITERSYSLPGENFTEAEYEDYARAEGAMSDERHGSSMLRGAKSNVEASVHTSHEKPFFALVVFNNNHFPHLMAEDYPAVPPECFENSGNTTNQNNKGCESRMRMPEGSFDDDSDGSNDLSDGKGSGSDAAFGLDEDDCDYDNWYPQKKYYYVNGEAYDCEGDVGHYYSSMRTMDDSLKAMFLALEEAGELNNTIVVGAGDHGETPVTMKRLNDVDAPILQVPIWMRVPRWLLPERAFIPLSNSARTGAKQGNHTLVGEDTYLQSNINKTVSVLDIMPTLRDILNYSNVYTQDERRLCATGSSLLTATLSSERIVPGWQGPPLQPGQKTAIFMTKSEALVHYEGHLPESHVAKFRFDEEDPIFTLFEKRGEDWTNEERKVWSKALQDGGWLDGGQKSGFVSRRLPNLHKILEDVISPLDMTEGDYEENVGLDEQE